LAMPPCREGFELVPIHGNSKGTDEFPIQKCAIIRKFKEIGGIARRRTAVRRTSDSADWRRTCGKGPFTDGNEFGIVNTTILNRDRSANLFSLYSIHCLSDC